MFAIDSCVPIAFSYQQEELSLSHNEDMLEVVASFVSAAAPEAIAGLKETRLISGVLFRESAFPAGHSFHWQVLEV